jgi:hypothetical protein
MNETAAASLADESGGNDIKSVHQQASFSIG